MISSLPKWVSSLFGNALRPNAKVMETSYLSPHLKKIRFQGDISSWNFQIGYASVIRVSETEFRNYTIAYHDTDNGFFDIVFHIHGNGIGSEVIDLLKTDDELFVSQPRGKRFYESLIKRQCIVGDETSLGMACSFLPLLKQGLHQFQFIFELDEAHKNVPHLLGLENCLVVPKKTFRDEKWIRDLLSIHEADLQNTCFVLTGNVRSVQAFRKVLKDNTTLKTFSQGYWLEGKKGL